jgi:2-methylaconitate cis-trans-isomerase PrpF
MFDQPLVSYGMSCGNISAAVGPFAVDEGLVKKNRRDQDWPSLYVIKKKPC